eukprot:3009234-Amphidinium_carterae.1
MHASHDSFDLGCLSIQWGVFDVSAPDKESTEKTEITKRYGLGTLRIGIGVQRFPMKVPIVT